MKAIQATYLGPTNTKPSRVKVWAKDCKPLIEQFDHDLCFDKQSLIMADRYATMMEWDDYRIVGGTLPNGDNCFVLVDGEYK